jgi:hypothetical protein
MRPSSLAWLVFATFTALYAATAGARGYSIDGDFAYRLARDVVDRGPLEAFRAKRELLRRWGPGLPLLSTPFVAPAVALARRLPPAGSVPLDNVPGASGRVVVAALADLPPISRDATNGPGDTPALDLAVPPDSGPITAITVVSSLAFATDLPDGTVIANVSMRSFDGTMIGSPLPLRAGIETAEWSWGDPGRRPSAHRLAPVAGTWDGNPDARHFRANLPIPNVVVASAHAVAIEAVSPTGRLHIAAVIASTADGVVPLTTAKPGASAVACAPGGGCPPVEALALNDGAATTMDRVTRAAFGFANVLPAAATVSLMVPVASAFGATVRVALTLSGLTGLATLTWPYARLDFAETLAGACAFGAFAMRLAAARPDLSPRRALALNVAAGALALGAGVAKYTALWFAPLVAIDAMLRPGALSRRQVAGLFLVPGTAFAALALVISSATGAVAPRIISELPDGLARGWLGYPLGAGLLSLLVSSGKGLLWYAPPVALAFVGVAPFVRQHGVGAFLPLAASATYLLVFSSKGNWHGGGWGPRYVVPMVPFALIASLPVLTRALDVRRPWRGVARFAVVASFLAGLGINGLGVLKHLNAYTIMFRDHIAPQLPEYGAAQGGALARTYVDYFRQAKATTELVRPPGVPTGIHGTPLPSRGLGHLIDRDSPLIVKLWPTRPARFALTLYFCNYDGPPDVPRRQNVTVLDTFEAQTVRIDDFADGVYATWTIEAVPGQPVTIAVHDSGRAFPVLSGLFFDPPERAGASAGNHGASAPSRPLPSVDRTTGGAWVGRYGSEGAVLPAFEMGPRDAGALPSYIDVITGGIPVWVDTGELERADAALLYAPGFSPIAAHAWLLGNDLAASVFPADTALRQKALASPPWRYVHGLEIHSPHPEYGLGIDLWPLVMRDWFASWPSVMAAIWAVEGLLILIATGGAVGLAVAWVGAGSDSSALPPGSPLPGEARRPTNATNVLPSPHAPGGLILQALMRRAGLCYRALMRRAGSCYRALMRRAGSCYRALMRRAGLSYLRRVVDWPRERPQLRRERGEV